jgi:colicin import membrane protein
MASGAQRQAVCRFPAADSVPGQLRAFTLSLLVHALLLLLIWLGSWLVQPKPIVRPPVVIDATLVDLSQSGRSTEEPPQESENPAQPEPEPEPPQPDPEQLQRERQAELERQRQQQAAREQRQREEAAQREREQERQRRQQQAEQRRREQQEALERERERQREELEALRREREQAERERQQAEQALEEARRQREAQRQQEAERQRREAEQAAQQRAQAQAARQSLQDQYIARIASLVESSWRRPPTAQPGIRCVVRVFQIPGGEVISAEISGGCDADRATQTSIISAVERASPLPYRGFEDVFQREIDFVFRYDG